MNWLGTDTDKATKHFAEYGFKEGRAADSFDELTYMASNTDLIPAYSGDRSAATRHFVEYGYKEGRNISSFNASNYLSSNMDLIGMAMDPTEHYVMFGFNEGR